MNPLKNEFDITGTLTEDFRHIELDNPKMNRYLLRNLEGVTLDIRIKPFKNKRSDRQNRYFWSAVVPHIQAWLREVKGEKHTNDEVYTWIKVVLIGQRPKVITILGKEVITFDEISFSAMDTQEFYDTVELIRAKMLEKGCDIPEPIADNTLSEQWRAKNNGKLTDD